MLPLTQQEGLTAMWYVIQVQGGQEEKTAELIRRQVTSDAMEECFIPKKERVKKLRGSWKQIEEVLFPGYVFAAAREPEELHRQLKQITKMTKILQDGTCYFLPLSEEEENIIKNIGDNYHLTKLSKIKIEEGKKITILDGPLKAQEGNIVKVDLHRREVVVRIPFMGRMVDLKLGIEMIAAEK